jgi:Flp pilus assembly protein TadG
MRSPRVEAHTMKFFTFTNSSPRHRPGARRRGAAMVEFAAVSIVFLVMVMGMLQFGIYLNATNALWNLSREGARYAAVQDPKTAGIDDTIRTHIRQVVPNTLLATDIQAIDIQPEASKRSYGNQVTVTVTYDMKRKLFLASPGWLIGSRGLGNTYTTRTTMMMEAGG